MEFNEVVKKRFSCRKFSDKPVDRKTLTEILKDGSLSPSSCNLQRWSLMAINDPEIIEKIGKEMRYDPLRVNGYAETVPAYIAVLKNNNRLVKDVQLPLLGGSVDGMMDYDIGIVTQQIVLSATSRGLGNVIIGYYDDEKVSSLLNLPVGVELGLFIAVGYPADDKERKHIRLPEEELFIFNRYQ